jgi:hypothetical protein
MRRLRGEAGIALPVALGVLAVVGVLSASVFAVSLRLTNSSSASRDAKRALAAADAGLEAAVFRMNELGSQTESKCFTTVAVNPATGTDPETGSTPAAGECAGVSESMGNGSSYTYYVTPALEQGDVCAGLPIFYTGGVVTIVQRCVTSIGKAGGEVRRVQARVASYSGAKLFPIGGILAINGIKVENSAYVGGMLGSNGQIELGNSSWVSGDIVLGTASSPPPILGNSSYIGGDVRYRSEAEGAFVLAPVDMGNTATVNDNVRLTNGQDGGSKFSYTASTRSLTLNNSGTVTLGGGTYNFCRVTLGNSGRINIAAGATVRLFLDSPDRAGSGCIPSGQTAAQARAAGYGGMTLGNSATFNNSSGHAIHMQIYMYGYTNGTHTVSFDNSSWMKGAIYAPNSTLIWKNSAGITGGISASKVEFKNSAAFGWAGDSNGFSLSDLRSDTVSVFYRMAWTECQRKRTATTDPESGC